MMEPGERGASQIGQRLAGSPTSTVSAPVMSSSSHSKKTISDESPIAAIAQNSFSTSVCEQSTLSMSSNDDDRHSLNEGFIMNEEKDGDITRIMSEPAISGSHHDTGEYVMLSDVLPRESVSESMLSESRMETPRSHSRSYSMDSTLDGSTRKASLKRGKPNAIAIGLLQGDERKVHKLRRSFGLDKSDIGFPFPVSVANTSDEDHYVALDCSVEILTDKNSKQAPTSEMRDSVPCHTLDRKEEKYDSAENEQSKSITNIAKTKEHESMDVDQTEFDKEQKKEETAKSLAKQKQESKDSLLSELSCNESPVERFREREMTRSVSADSGKGSICDESSQEGTDCTMELNTASLDETEIDTERKSLNPEDTVTDQSVDSMDTDNPVFYEAAANNETNNLQGVTLLLQKKSVSTQDLVSDVERTPTRVSRSKSLLEASLLQKRVNVKPNLQISAETHKLLARAGYIKESKSESKPEFDDFAVPGKFPFIQQTEAVNPRRESIIQLQKNNAGHVKQNIMQFDRIVEDNREIEGRHASPYRFSNSTSRKMKTPLVLHKTVSLNRDSNGTVLNISGSRDRNPLGMAKVPISTQMLKSSEPLNTSSEEKLTGLKRKPSIYYADKQGLNSSLKFELENNHNRGKGTSPVMKIDFIHEEPELDESLMSAINNCCTPLSELAERDLQEDKANKSDKENSLTPSKMPEIKQPIITTPLCLDTVKFRTASNKTPIDLIKVSKSPRSPIKPLKRLGSSPHSPRNRVVHSPKLIKSNRRSLLSMPSPSDDMNNL